MKIPTGFTLIEILLVMGIMAALAGITGLSLSGLYSKADLNSTQDVLTSQLKSQQLKAMAGYTSGAGQPTAQGIYFEAGQYTLFSGDSFNPDDPQNIALPAGQNISLSTSNLTDGVLVFLPGGGEVASWQPGAAITISDTNTGEQRSLQLNLMGAVTDL